MAKKTNREIGVKVVVGVLMLLIEILLLKYCVNHLLEIYFPTVPRLDFISSALLLVTARTLQEKRGS